MKRAWSKVDRWGPGAISIVALLVTLWYGLQAEARSEEIRNLINSRNQMEIALRTEIQTWQAHVVSLKETMIKAGIQNVPPSPRPVIVRQSADGRPEVSNKRR